MILPDRIITIMFFLNFRYVFVINTIMLLSIGCATAPTKTVQIVYNRGIAEGFWQDEILEDKFKEYWFNRFSGEVEDNYNSESPYFQEMVSLGKYRSYVQNARRSVLVRMEIAGIEKISDYLIKIECNAVLVRDGKQIEVSMADRWVNVDGKWYHVIKDPLFSL